MESKMCMWWIQKRQALIEAFLWLYPLDYLCGWESRLSSPRVIHVHSHGRGLTIVQILVVLKILLIVNNDNWNGQRMGVWLRFTCTRRETSKHWFPCRRLSRLINRGLSKGSGGKWGLINNSVCYHTSKCFHAMLGHVPSTLTPSLTLGRAPYWWGATLLIPGSCPPPSDRCSSGIWYGGIKGTQIFCQ